MPTPLSVQEKQGFITIVQAAPFPGGADEAIRLQTILNNYEDVYLAIMRQLNLFCSNNAYLTQAISVFNSSELQAVGIWVNASFSSPPMYNPSLIINSTLTDNGGVLIAPASPWTAHNLVVLGATQISSITVSTYTRLDTLFIGPGVVVDLVNSSDAGASIGELFLPFRKSTPSTLKAIVNNSVVDDILQEPGSYFGGYTNIDPDSACGSAVASLAAGNITSTSVKLTWIPPSMQSPVLAYLFINIYYRMVGSNEWLLATDSTGYFNGETGYTFTTLSEDTHFEFYVAVTCINGGVNNSSTVTAKTECC